MSQTPMLTRAVSAVRKLFSPGGPLQTRRFHAARVDNTTANWLALETSINQELQSDLDRLRTRGRDLRHNNDYAAKFCRMCGDNIIGPSGIRLQAKVVDQGGKQDRGANNAIEAAWRRWGAVCDVSGRQHFRDFCSSLVESLPADGEFLVRMVTGPDAQNEFNFALQRIDVDRIDTSYNTTLGGNTVIMGVELNAYRRPVALHLFEGHPNDGQRTSRRLVRIPAEELIHGFKATQADQVRGFPWMAPGMLSLHHLGGFGLAALLAAEHGANHYGFFTTPDGLAPAIGAQDEAQQTIMTSQPGVYDTLPTGVGFQPHESKYPNEVFGPFVKTTLQRIASGWGVAYHGLANDLEGVNFSSIRSGTIEERDRWSTEQEWFIATFMERIYPLWVRTALLSGAIVLDNGSTLPATKFNKFLAHEWQPRRWDWVDPKKDMEAKILGVRAGILAPQDIAASMGYDFEDTLIAIAEAQKVADSLGVQLTAYDPAPGVMPVGVAEPKADTTEATAAAAKHLESNTRAISTLATTMGALAKREQPAPVVNITNEGARHEIHNHMTPTPVEVRNAITVPEQNNTYEILLPEQRAAAAPVVNVTNQVQPAPVTVNNTHPVRAVQTVQRDANDEIISTTTTFEA